jgi:single-strand DNA-binding protein
VVATDSKGTGVDNNEMRLRGNVVADPTQLTVASGAKLTSFRIASNTRRLNKMTNEWETTETLFLTVNCWRQLGDNVFASLHRGDLVDVRGRLRQRDYDDKDGKKVTTFELEAYSVAPDLARYIVTMARPPRPLPEASEQTPAAGVVPAQADRTETNPWTEPVRPSGEAAA